jgi:hypothetical protein
MNQYQIAIVALLALQAATLIILWLTHLDREWFRKAWVRDSWELLHWKRYGVMRDRRTGRYHKKGEN